MTRPRTSNRAIAREFIHLHDGVQDQRRQILAGECRYHGGVNTERDWLFGVFAVQLGLATPDRVLDCAARWALDRSEPLAVRLQRENDITPADRDAIEHLVSAAIDAHGGDAGRAFDTLAADAGLGDRSGRATVAATPRRRDAAEAGAADQPGAGVTREDPGRYRTLGGGPPTELGRGGIGRVVATFDVHLGREVAVKELLRGAAETDDDSGRSGEVRFLREAGVTGQLEHPNIVPVYELGRRADGTLYYTFRHVFAGRIPAGHRLR